MKRRDLLKLIISVAISELAGIVGSFFTVSAIPNWYSALVKPALNPPAWVFGPVWTTLYALMGIAAFLIWREYSKLTLSEVEGLIPQRKRQIKMALGVFGIQLFLNAIWSIIFFGLQNPGWALVDIVLLWLAIAWTMVVFYKISKPAAYLLVPYLLWVSFAAYLNYSIWMFN
ncbi:MAG: tryptophan-rich sensory protein [Candidatus Nealsonbacteria bacterium]|nr:tryptophan-rich sensory protein [Candidatus Nealsonbacteria bacterium]